MSCLKNIQTYKYLLIKYYCAKSAKMLSGKFLFLLIRFENFINRLYRVFSISSNKQNILVA